MNQPKPCHINITAEAMSLHERINGFLRDYGLPPYQISAQKTTQIVEAYIGDLLMPRMYQSRVQGTCSAIFGDWYVTDHAQAHRDCVSWTVYLHQSVIDLTLSKIEDTLFGHLKLPNDWIWDVKLGPWGAMLIVPINPVSQTVKPVGYHTPKIPCGAVVYDRWNQKHLKISEMPLTLDDAELDPNTAVLLELQQQPERRRVRVAKVAAKELTPSGIKAIVDDLIRDRVNHTEGRYAVPARQKHITDV